MILAFALLAVRWPTFTRMNEQLAELLSAGAAIPDSATFVSIALAPRGVAAGGRPLSQKAQPFLHAGAFLAAQRPLVDLGNYEARSGLFPLIFRPALDPYRHLASAEGMEAVPPSLDFARYETETGKRVEYLLVWGPLEAVPASPRLSALVTAIDERYELVQASQPQGLARLYRRQP
jgi:hypothetical protein